MRVWQCSLLPGAPQRLTAKPLPPAQSKLAATERAPASPSPFGPVDADVRELQRSLTVRQREAAAAQEAAGLARGEAKRTAALLQQERDRSAGLQDEVAQWRDEYTQVPSIAIPGLLPHPNVPTHCSAVGARHLAARVAPRVLWVTSRVAWFDGWGCKSSDTLVHTANGCPTKP